MLGTPACEFWSQAFEISTLRAIFLVCTLADGFVLRRWCRIIWGPLGGSFGTLDFGFWILDSGFPIKLITDRSSSSGDSFNGYPILGCALWLAGSLPRRLKWPREKREHPRQRHIIRLGP